MFSVLKVHLSWFKHMYRMWCVYVWRVCIMCGVSIVTYMYGMWFLCGVCMLWGLGVCMYGVCECDVLVGIDVLWMDVWVWMCMYMCGACV